MSRKVKHEIWFAGRKIKRDYRAVPIGRALNYEQQAVVRSFFRYLLVLHGDCSVSQVIAAYRRSRLTNTILGRYNEC